LIQNKLLCTILSFFDLSTLTSIQIFNSQALKSILMSSRAASLWMAYCGDLAGYNELFISELISPQAIVSNCSHTVRVHFFVLIQRNEPKKNQGLGFSAIHHRFAV